MKNTMKQKTLLTLVLALLATHFLIAQQHKYLKISLSNAKNDFVSFPPGTKFQLTDETNKVVYSDKDTADSYVIDKAYKLTVYPAYKETSDIFRLTEGKVEMVDNSAYFKAIKQHKKETNSQDYGAYRYDKNGFTNGLTMKKTLEFSPVNPKQYNATFEFNNGITATYTDGEMIALLDGKQLKVEGNYIIYSKFGLIKLSFRSSNGETWWFFEPNK